MECSSYTILPKDTAFSIAKNTNTSLTLLAALNPGKDDISTLIASENICLPQTTDIFEKTTNQNKAVDELANKIVKESTANQTKSSPAEVPSNGKVFIAGEEKTATIVISVSHNQAYVLGKNGEYQKFLIASGKKDSPTNKGVFQVSGKEDMNKLIDELAAYKKKVKEGKINPKDIPAYYKTNRAKTPEAFGSNVITMRTINPQTGEVGSLDLAQMLHGTNNKKSVTTADAKQRAASNGCVRFDDKAIKHLIDTANRGDIIYITD